MPRFSNVAFVSVLLLLGSGIWAAFEHLPTLASLWETTYGKTVILKVGLVTAAIALAVRQPAARRAPGLDARAVDRSCCCAGSSSGEVLLVAAAVVGGALLSSLPPPAKALALEGGALARRRPRRRSARR